MNCFPNVATQSQQQIALTLENKSGGKPAFRIYIRFYLTTLRWNYTKHNDYINVQTVALQLGVLVVFIIMIMQEISPG